jgi:TDG/mug DNA glycosylase family protein
MELLQGFAPVAGAGARTLILGSMPGIASLDADQYYAFPRNAFWKIMGDMYAAGPELEYSSRLHILTSNHIALWDVIASCQRPGSLDSAITESGMKTNNFGDFFQQHPEISRICFNGGKASELFTKKVLPGLEQTFEYIKLPSTSPAHAAMRYAEKLQAWSVIK